MDSIKEIKEIKEGLKSLLDRLETLENTIPIPLSPELYNKFLVELPEDGERLYCIDNFQSTILSKIFDISNMNDVKRFEDGLFFETKEEAEQHLKERKLLLKLRQWAKIKNDGWEPDWKDGEQKKTFITYYKSSTGVFNLAYESTWTTNRFSKLPYFKSIELAKECIDLFGDEIKEVLC